MVHLATIPVTGTGINPARSLGAAVIFNDDKAWDDHVSPTHLFQSLNPFAHHFEVKLLAVHSLQSLTFFKFKYQTFFGGSQP